MIEPFNPAFSEKDFTADAFSSVIELLYSMRNELQRAYAHIKKLEGFCLNISDKEIMDSMGERIQYLQKHIRQLESFNERSTDLAKAVIFEHGLDENISSYLLEDAIDLLRKVEKELGE